MYVYICVCVCIYIYIPPCNALLRLVSYQSFEHTQKDSIGCYLTKAQIRSVNRHGALLLVARKLHKINARGSTHAVFFLFPQEQRSSAAPCPASAVLTCLSLPWKRVHTCRVSRVCLWLYYHACMPVSSQYMHIIYIYKHVCGMTVQGRFGQLAILPRAARCRHDSRPRVRGACGRPLAARVSWSRGACSVGALRAGCRVRGCMYARMYAGMYIWIINATARVK
jgi:hypothetical protein